VALAPIKTVEVAVNAEVGAAFTTAVTLIVETHPVDPVTVQVYVPAIAVVALVDTVGFCEEELKLLGPDQAYVAPVTVFACKLRVLPAQVGELPAP
jgi:hypothetical protein